MKLILNTAILILSLLAASNAFSAKMTFGEGRFYSKDYDSLDFYNKQLIFSAYKDVITKELDAMGLDSANFWTQFDLRFEESFASVEESLKKKYRIDETEEEAKGKPELSPAKKRKNKEAFSKAMRFKKLTAKAKYKNINGLIQSYKKHKSTQSTKYPNSRYLSLYAKVDRKELNKLYFSLTHVGNIQKYETLYVSADFELDGVTWSDLGVEIYSEFQNTITNQWGKWFEGNFSAYANEVRVVNADKKREFEDLFKSSNEILPNAIWLNLKIRVRKSSGKNMHGVKEFNFDGSYILNDIAKNKVIDFYDFSALNQKITFETPDKLRHRAATLIYNLPVSKFVELKSKMSKNSAFKKSLTLNIIGYSNILSLFTFEQSLASQGIKLQITTNVTQYNNKAATIEVSYEGTPDKFDTYLKSLDGKIISNHSVKVDEIDSKNIQLIKIEDEDE